MKKLALIMMGLAILSSTGLLAQTEKGKYMIMGSSSLDFSFGKSKTKSGGSTQENYTYFDLNIYPMAGYTVINNMAVGLFMDGGIYNTNYSDSDQYSKGTTLALGPFARYYFANFNGFMPMAEVAAGFGVDNCKYDYGYGEGKDKAFFMEYWAGVGATYFLTEHFGIDGLVGYYCESYKYKGDDNPDARSETGYTDKYGELYFYFGVVVMLGK
jgi:outer membrane protein